MEENEKEQFNTEETPKKKTSYKKLIFKLIFLALIGFVSVYLIFKITEEFNGEMLSFGELIGQINVLFLLLTLFFIGLLICVEAFKFKLIIDTSAGKSKWRTAFKVALTGKFYDNITPFAVGGQPMQIVYLSGKGIHAGTATSIVMTKFFNQMFALSLVGGLLMTLNMGALSLVGDSTTQITLTVFGWIGFASNLILPIFIILFCLFPTMTTKIVVAFVKVGHKLKIVKDKDKAIQKALSTANDFQMSVRTMAKSPVRFIVLILLSLIEPLVNMSLPFFAAIALGGPQVEPTWSLLFNVMTLNIYACNSAAIIPTPGNGGALETTLSFAFSSLFSGAAGWVIFLCRFCSFYIYLIIGFILTLYDFIRQIVRTVRARKKQKNEEATDDQPNQSDGQDQSG
ncbi:MAG: YbhN family protein [Candidatus Coproplasma sp.]